VRGIVNDDSAPVLTRVHVRDTLADVLHLQRPDRGISVAAALRHIAAQERGVVVVLTDPDETAAALDRLVQADAQQADAQQATDPVREWRRHGVGAQILADLGVHRLRVLGTPRRFLGLSGFGLEIVGYEDIKS
jgi:3,4-dihydroxy 2-butanone 4-phosphate synthase/GTP cyclohydrolase II